MATGRQDEYKWSSDDEGDKVEEKDANDPVAYKLKQSTSRKRPVKRRSARKSKKSDPIVVKEEDRVKNRQSLPTSSGSDSDDDDRVKKMRSTWSSSPPSFMTKGILEASKKKQDTEVASKIRRLADIAQPAPARTRAAKAELVKFFCADCESYYKTFPNRDASTSACRHRRVEARPVTPPHYWQLEIPSSPEDDKQVDRSNKSL